MSHPLDRVIARLNRAEVHIGELDEMTVSFLRETPPPYGHEIIPDPDLGVFEFDLVGKVVREPDHVLWGVVIGDAVNNLRAALDNLVWALTVNESGDPPLDPLPFNSPWRRVRYPVVFDAARWDACATKNLWGVRPGLLADFEALQPFVTGQQAGEPTREPLAVLDELWNIDKHRHLHLGRWFAGLHAVRSGFAEFWGPDGPKGWEYEIIDKALGPFEDGTHLGRVRIIERDVVGPLPWMYVQPQLAFDVAFEQGPPAYGGRLIPTLRQLHETVSLIVRQFESEFP